MKLLYNFASRQRPEKCFATIENIINLSEHDNYIILLNLDLDDAKMTSKEVRDKLLTYPNVMPVYGSSKTKIEAINANIWMIDSFDILINVSDDQEFLVKGFDKRIISDMLHWFPNTDGILHYPDGTFNGEKMMTLSIIGSTYFKRTNKVYYEGYKSVFCDQEETRRAEELGKYKFINENIFVHKHWLFNPATILPDELNKRNDNEEIYEHDRQVYLRRNPILLIKFASRGRKQQFYKAMENIYSTIKTKYFKVIITADGDDEQMNNADVRWVISTYKNATIYYDKQVSKIDAINRNFDRHLEWSWCITMSDDMEFTVNGWDELMLSQIKQEWGDSLDFFAHFSDGFVFDKLPTMNICGRDYYKRFGYIYHPTYGSVSCDAENYFVAQMLGRYKYFKECYFNHIHPANIGVPSDHVYRLNDKFGQRDTDNYFNRMARLFDVQNPIMIPDILKKEMIEKGFKIPNNL